MSSGSAVATQAPVILCAGIAVEDYIFRVDRFPAPGEKARAQDFVVTGGGCAANAAVSVARLGGTARYAGPLGDDDTSERILQGLAREGVATDGVVRLHGACASVSGILVDATGERVIATRRDRGLATVRPRDPDALVRDVDMLLVDNRVREFVLPICAAAHARGTRIVLDADQPADRDDPLLPLASHVIFSAEALRGATGEADLAAALIQVGGFCPAFLAVTDGANGAYWRDGTRVAHVPAFTVDAVDTLGAGDVFHASFALAIAEGQDEIKALRFAAAAAACKCTRFGGIAGAPRRDETEMLLRSTAQPSDLH